MPGNLRRTRTRGRRGRANERAQPARRAWSHHHQRWKSSARPPWVFLFKAPAATLTRVGLQIFSKSTICLAALWLPPRRPQRIVVIDDVYGGGLVGCQRHAMFQPGACFASITRNRRHYHHTKV